MTYERALQNSPEAIPIVRRAPIPLLPPSMYPVDIFDPEGVPIPTARAVSISRFPGQRLVDVITHRKFLNSEGREVIYPLDIEKKPLFTTETIHDFCTKWGVDLGVAKHIQTVYQVTTMITGGLDSGLQSARLLQAAAVARGIIKTKGSIDEQTKADITRNFGLERNVENLLFNFQKIQTLIDHINEPEWLDSARQNIRSNGGLILASIIGDIASAFQDEPSRDDTEGYTEYLNAMDRKASAYTQMNIGQSDPDTPDFLYTNINDAIAYFKEIHFSKKFPLAYSFTHEVLQKLTGMSNEMRYNSHYLTLMFNQMLSVERMVTEEDLDRDAVRVRGSVKPAYSLLTKVFRTPEKRVEMLQAIKRENSPEDDHWTAVDALETLLKSEHPDEELLETIRMSMHEQYDIVRARMYAKTPEDINKITDRIHQILSLLKPFQLEELDRRAEMYVYDWVWSLEGARDATITQAPEEGGSIGYGNDPAGFILDRFLQAASGTLPYAAIHAHVPVHLGSRTNQNSGISTPNVIPVEFQIFYDFMRPIYDALDRAPHKRPPEERNLQVAGFSEPEVIEMLKKAQERAKEVDSQHRIERRFDVEPYSGVLMDFDGLMFDTKGFYESATKRLLMGMSAEKPIENQVSYNHFLQVFRFGKSMGDGCTNFMKALQSPETPEPPQRAMQKLIHAFLDPTWLNESAKLVGLGDQDLSDVRVRGEIMARMIEKEGQQLINDNPSAAKSDFLRPKEGFLKFLSMLQEMRIPIVVASAARRSTIEPVLQLYGIADMFDGIYAEEDILNIGKSKIGGFAYKPEVSYYMNAARAIPPRKGTGGYLIIGDRGLAEYPEGMHLMASSLFNSLLVNTDPSKRRTPGKRHMCECGSFLELIDVINGGRFAAENGDSTVLERIRQTLR